MKIHSANQQGLCTAYNFLGEHEKGTLVTCLSELTDIGKKTGSPTVFTGTLSNIIFM